MSVAALAWAFRQDLHPTPKLTLLALANFAGNEEGTCWPSIATLQRYTGQSRSTVFKALEHLKAADLIEIEMRSERGRQSSNLYRLRLDAEGSGSWTPGSGRRTDGGPGDGLQGSGSRTLTVREPSKDPGALARDDRNPAAIAAELSADVEQLRRALELDQPDVARDSLQRQLDDKLAQWQALTASGPQRGGSPNEQSTQ